MKEDRQRLFESACICFAVVFIVQQVILWIVVLNWSRRVAEIHPLFNQ